MRAGQLRSSVEFAKLPQIDITVGLSIDSCEGQAWSKSSNVLGSFNCVLC